MAEEQNFSVIVLAGQRSGIVNPIAERAGVSHKCLAPICGKPLVLHVFEMLAQTPGVRHVRLSMESDGWDGVRALAGGLEAKGITVDFAEAKETLPDSIYAAAQDIDGPILITTADNVLTSTEAVLTTMQPIFDGADASVGLTTRDAVLIARGQKPGSKSTVGYYKLSDGMFCNCNLYAVASHDVLQGAEAFREGGQFAKNRDRLVRAIGLSNAVRLSLGLVSLEGAMKRLSKRFGITIAPALLEDGSQAIDVDSFLTYDFAEKILKQREAEVV